MQCTPVLTQLLTGVEATTTCTMAAGMPCWSPTANNSTFQKAELLQSTCKQWLQDTLCTQATLGLEAASNCWPILGCAGRTITIPVQLPLTIRIEAAHIATGKQKQPRLPGPVFAAATAGSTTRAQLRRELMETSVSKIRLGGPARCMLPCHCCSSLAHHAGRALPPLNVCF
jgi:hypothetical protein